MMRTFTFLTVFFASALALDIPDTYIPDDALFTSEILNLDPYTGLFQMSEETFTFKKSKTLGLAIFEFKNRTHLV